MEHPKQSKAKESKHGFCAASPLFILNPEF